MFVMERIAHERKEWLLAFLFLAVGCLMVLFFCFNVEQPSLSETMIYDFGFDALCELYELCVWQKSLAVCTALASLFCGSF